MTIAKSAGQVRESSLDSLIPWPENLDLEKVSFFSTIPIFVPLPVMECPYIAKQT